MPFFPLKFENYTWFFVKLFVITLFIIHATVTNRIGLMDQSLFSSSRSISSQKEEKRKKWTKHYNNNNFDKSGYGPGGESRKVDKKFLKVSIWQGGKFAFNQVCRISVKILVSFPTKKLDCLENAMKTFKMKKAVVLSYM